MTTLFEAGQFWVIDSVSLRKVETFAPFNTYREAREAIGARWVDAELEG